MSLQSINKIVALVAKLSDKEIQAATRQALSQSVYIHPLKNAKATRMQDFGRHNLKVLDKIEGIRTLIRKLHAKHKVSTGKKPT